MLRQKTFLRLLEYCTESSGWASAPKTTCKHWLTAFLGCASASAIFSSAPPSDYPKAATSTLLGGPEKYSELFWPDQRACWRSHGRLQSSRACQTSVQAHWPGLQVHERSTRGLCEDADLHWCGSCDCYLKRPYNTSKTCHEPKTKLGTFGWKVPQEISGTFDCQAINVGAARWIVPEWNIAERYH